MDICLNGKSSFCVDVGEELTVSSFCSTDCGESLNFWLQYTCHQGVSPGTLVSSPPSSVNGFSQ